MQDLIEKRTMPSNNGCFIHILQINLSYSSVTDAGLLTLASLSCLQSLTILHFRGLTPSGLSAALLACGGLTKVKLHASIKLLLPQSLFRYLEARGCSFQWRDKEFQVYVSLTSITFFYPTLLAFIPWEDTFVHKDIIPREMVQINHFCASNTELCSVNNQTEYLYLI